MGTIGKIAIVLRGTIAAHIVGVASLPLISRLFPVAAFGQLQLYQSIMSVCLVVAAFRYEIAILAARSTREMRAVMQLAFIVNAGTALAAGLLVWSIGVAGWPVSTHAWSFGFLAITLAVFVGGVTQTLGYVVTRLEAYRVGARIKVAQACGYGVIGTTLGAVRPTTAGLIWADIATKGIGAALSLRYAVKAGLKPLDFVSRRRLKSIAVRYSDYPLISLPGGLCNALTVSIASFMIFATFGEQVAGQYGLIERSLTLPLNLIAIAITQVFTAEISKMIREGASGGHRIFRRITGLLAVIAAPPLLILMLFGRPIILFVFGQQWQLAAELCGLLIPFYFFSFVSAPTSLLLLAMQRQRQQFHWEWMRIATLIAAWVLIRIFKWDAITAISLNFGIMAAFCIAFLVMVDRILAGSEPANARSGEQLQ